MTDANRYQVFFYSPVTKKSVLVEDSPLPVPLPDVGQRVNVNDGNGNNIAGYVLNVEYQLSQSGPTGSRTRTFLYNISVAE